MTLKNAITVLVLSTFCLIFFSCKINAIFQQCGYKIKEFFPAIISGKNRPMLKVSTYSLTFCVFLLIIVLFLSVNNTVFSSAVFILVCLHCGIYCITASVIKNVKLTHRFLRIFITAILLNLCFCTATMLIFKTPKTHYFASLYLSIIPVFYPVLLSLAKIINLPYDFLRYKISVFRCEKIIAKNKNLIKIGITGSSGKTSVKNFLKKMLETKYSVLATPMSFNTPLGICKTVKGGIENFEVFIAEMGARYKNDIKTLCKIVKPNVGVITSILCQHTKTLGGIEGVKKAKNRLIEGLTGQKVAFFNNSSKENFDLYNKAECKKFLVGDGGFVNFKNAVQTKDGIDFELVVGEKTYKTFTPLLGFHNLENVCTATAVALYLQVDIGKILSVIPTLSPPKHRAEIIKTTSGVTVIDDGYNANIKGIISTATAVGKLDGKKFAVTSGIVELGEESGNLNLKVGQVLGENFSLVIAMGINANSICDGVKSVGGKFIQLADMKSVKIYLSNKLKKGDVIAFFNDLPDAY